jgi:hypothetical protein
MSDNDRMFPRWHQTQLGDLSAGMGDVTSRIGDLNGYVGDPTPKLETSSNSFTGSLS